MRKSLETATDKNAHRFLFDSRDRGTALRLPILSEGLGVFRCHTIFNGTECCPPGIPVDEMDRAFEIMDKKLDGVLKPLIVF